MAKKNRHRQNVPRYYFPHYFNFFGYHYYKGGEIGEVDEVGELGELGGRVWRTEEKSLGTDIGKFGTGMEKFFARKKSQNMYQKYLVPEKKYWYR